ncbi:MAG: hypothetical protein LIO93_03760, partial [Bacteroidales bacterium]|nr:hypothetical protein [Bacteroidales bacterium]
ENMLSVVQWCIDKSLIQEGYTLLQEGIISYFLSDHENKMKREFTSAYLNYRLRGNFDVQVFSDVNKEIINEIQTHLESFRDIDEWTSIYSQITELRNDINHGGMIDYPASSGKFENKLKELYDRVKLLISLT